MAKSGTIWLSHIRDDTRICGQRPGMLLNVLQYPGQLPATKNYLAPNVSSVKVGSPVEMLIGSVCTPAAGGKGQRSGLAGGSMSKAASTWALK